MLKGKRVMRKKEIIKKTIITIYVPIGLGKLLSKEENKVVIEEAKEIYSYLKESYSDVEMIYIPIEGNGFKIDIRG